MAITADYTGLIPTAAIDRVFAIICDMEAYPAIMPEDIESVVILARNGDTTISEWLAMVEGSTYWWIERDQILRDQYRIEFAMLAPDDPDRPDGPIYDFDDLRGYWQVSTVPEGVSVKLEMTIDQGIPDLEALIGDTLKEAILEFVQQLIEKITEEVTRPVVPEVG